MHDIIYLLTGFVVGAMNAIAGGGMLVGFPVLVATGIPPIVANATAYVINPLGQLCSAIGYRKYLRKVPRRYALLLIPNILGAMAGALLLRNTNPDHFARMIPLLVLFGVALFVFQPFLHFHLHGHLKGRTKRLLPLLLVGLAILPISFYGGYFGAGYGFLMLAFLGFTSIHDAHMMNAMKNVSAAVLSVVALICLYGSNLIDWRAGLIAAAGAAVGGYVGSRSALRVSSHLLRLFIITVGLSAVVYLFMVEY